jgi:MFS family permease
MMMLAAYPSVLAVFRDDLQRYLRIDAARFGLLFSLGPLAGVACVVLGGAMVRRLGTARLIRWCLLGTAAGMGLVAAAGPRYVPVLIGCVICGALSGALALAVNVYLTRLFPRDRRRILALNLAVSCGGGILFPLAAEALLTASHRGSAGGFGAALRLPMLIIAVILAAGAIAFRMGARTQPRHTVVTPRISRIRPSIFLPLPVVWLGVLLAIHGTVDTAIYTWMPKFLAGPSFAPPLAAPGIVLALYAVAYLVSRIAVAFAPEAWGRRRLMVVPGLLGGGVFLAGILSRSAMLTAAGYVLGGLCWSAEYPALLAAVSQRAKAQFGQAMAAITVLSAPLQFGAVYAVGWYADHHGKAAIGQPIALLACGFLVVGIGGALWLIFWDAHPARAGRRRGGDEAAASIVLIPGAEDGARNTTDETDRC